MGVENTSDPAVVSVASSVAAVLSCGNASDSGTSDLACSPPVIRTGPDDPTGRIRNRNCSESSIYNTDFEDNSSDCGSSNMAGCRRRRGSISATNYQPLSEKIQAKIESGEPFFSLEFFPPRTKSGACNLLAR